MFARAAVVSVILAAAVSGCAMEAGPRSDDNVLRTGWNRVDVPLPEAAERMQRIGSAGPARLSAGAPVVINFWASTCEPCKRELPFLERLNHDGIGVVGVCRDNVLKFARQEIRDRGVTYPNYSDSSADVMFGLRKVLYPNGIPTTVVVRGGRVRWVHIGAFDSYAQLHREVFRRLAP